MDTDNVQKDQVSSISDATQNNNQVNTPNNNTQSNTVDAKALEEKISKLETKLTAADRAIQERDEYAQLISFLASQPDLAEQTKERWNKVYGSGESEEPKVAEQGNNTDPKVENLEKKVTSTEAFQRNQIVNEFENEAGIANLPDEEKDNIRKAIAGKISTWGHSSLQAISVDRLKGMLQDAYKTVNNAPSGEQMAGAAKVMNNKQAAFGSMSSINVNQNTDGVEFSEETLTGLQKLGIDPKRAKEVEQKYNS